MGQYIASLRMFVVAHVVSLWGYTSAVFVWDLKFCDERMMMEFRLIKAQHCRFICESSIGQV